MAISTTVEDKKSTWSKTSLCMLFSDLMLVILGNFRARLIYILLVRQKKL